MKKKSKGYKAGCSRFILLVMVALIVGGRSFAQTCTEFVPPGCNSCNGNLDFDPKCVTPCYQAKPTPMLTNLEFKGAGPTSTLTISAAAIAGVTSVRVENITLYDPACVIVGGGPYNSSSFPAATNIVFQDFNDHIIVHTTGTIPGSFTGYTINFIVNVYDAGNVRLASRNYFFKARNDNLIVGDTHITTVDGTKYDFQAVGEFIALLGEGGDNLQIQTRQTAVATTGPGNDPQTGLTTCVSVNTAVAAQVGTHRVTYQPRIDGVPDSSGMQLRVDGKLTEIGDKGIDLGSGGRVTKSTAGGGVIIIDFPDGTSLTVTPAWWSSYNQWYLNLAVNNTVARKGISGVVPYIDTSHVVVAVLRRLKSWLPALPDGSNVGTMPQDMHQRFITLYQTFADAWRVTNATSLFDYASGKSTADYTNKNWPVENGQSCPVTGQTPKTPIDLATAQQLTIGIVNPVLKQNAIFDVMVTGEATFAQTYLLTQKVQTNTTGVKLNVSKDTSNSGEAITLTAIVTRKFSTGTDAVAGTVTFTADGNKLGEGKIDANGRATLATSTLEVGKHQIAATFTPDSGSAAFASSSNEVTHIVTGDNGGIGGILHKWWLWLIVLVILIIIIAAMRKKKP